MLIHLDEYRKRRMALAAGANQEVEGQTRAGEPAIGSFAAVVIFRQRRRLATEGLAASAFERIYPLASRY